MVADLEVETRDGSDFAEFDVGRIVRAVGHVGGEQIGQPGDGGEDLLLELGHLGFLFAEGDLQVLDLLPGGGIGAALLAQLVAFGAHRLGLLTEFAVVGVEREQTVDVDRALAAGAVRLDEVAVLSDEFHIQHFDVFSRLFFLGSHRLSRSGASGNPA